jgi:hypothetical protein
MRGRRNYFSSLVMLAGIASCNNNEAGEAERLAEGHYLTQKIEAVLNIKESLAELEGDYEEEDLKSLAREIADYINEKDMQELIEKYRRIEKRLYSMPRKSDVVEEKR